MSKTLIQRSYYDGRLGQHLHSGCRGGRKKKNKTRPVILSSTRGWVSRGWTRLTWYGITIGTGFVRRVRWAYNGKTRTAVFDWTKWGRKTFRRAFLERKPHWPSTARVRLLGEPCQKLRRLCYCGDGEMETVHGPPPSPPPPLAGSNADNSFVTLDGTTAASNACLLFLWPCV